MVKVVIAVTIPALPVAAAPTRAAAVPTTAVAAPTNAPAVPTTAVAAPPAAPAVPTTAVAAPTNAPTVPVPATTAPTAVPPTAVPPTATATVEMPTNTPEPSPAEPTQLTKSNWQVDFLYPGGSYRLEVEFAQNGGTVSGSNRDNNAEVDIVTTGTVTDNTMVITFTLSNGGSPRGSATCTGTIDAGPPQTISGTFTAPSNEGIGGTSGNCTFR